MPRPAKNESMCYVCDRVIGVWLTPFNKSLKYRDYKLSRHRGVNEKWCSGSGYSVPDNAVIPVRLAEQSN